MKSCFFRQHVGWSPIQVLPQKDDFTGYPSVLDSAIIVHRFIFVIVSIRFTIDHFRFYFVFVSFQVHRYRFRFRKRSSIIFVFVTLTKIALLSARPERVMYRTALGMQAVWTSEI